MNKLRRLAKLGVLVVLGSTLAGCYVVPIGWGHGHRGHGHHYEGGQGQQRGGEMPRGGRGH